MKKIIAVIIILILAIGGCIYLFLKYRGSNNDKQESVKLNLNNMIKISSPVFLNNLDNRLRSIPQKYTCDGENINPEFLIEGVAEQTKSLVLIMDDPDAPLRTFTHWLVWNISPKTKEIKENSVPEGAVLGMNDFRKVDYGGPCPPTGVHRYFFRIYALDTILNIPQGSERKTLEEAMENHIIDKGELVARYSRQ